MFVGTQKENEKACDEVRGWGVEGGSGGGGPLVQLLAVLCTPSFLLCDSVAGDSQAISSAKQQSLNGSTVCTCLPINISANKKVGPSLCDHFGHAVLADFPASAGQVIICISRQCW